VNEDTCEQCEKRSARVKLLLAWGSVFAGAASAIGASAAFAQVFFS
jgi:hypothetical protein